MKQSIKANEMIFLFGPQRLRMLLKYSIFTAEPESDDYDLSEAQCHGPMRSKGMELHLKCVNSSSRA